MVFVSKYFSSLPAVVGDTSGDNQAEDSSSVASEVDKLIIASIGDDTPRPHVIVLTRFVVSVLFRSLIYRTDINEVESRGFV
jgi:hypothetical protein